MFNHQYCFQSHQEKTYQEYMATKAKERANELEHYYEQIVSRSSTELSSILEIQPFTS